MDAHIPRREVNLCMQLLFCHQAVFLEMPDCVRCSSAIHDVVVLTEPHQALALKPTQDFGQGPKFNPGLPEVHFTPE